MITFNLSYMKILKNDFSKIMSLFFLFIFSLSKSNVHHPRVNPRNGVIYRQLETKPTDFEPIYQVKARDYLILNDKTILTKIAPLKTYHQSITIGIAWGDSIPKPLYHIIAIYNVYLGLERDRFSKTLKAKDIMLILESVWCDQMTLDEHENFLISSFIKEHKMEQVSTRISREIILPGDREEGLKKLDVIIAPVFLKEGEGLTLPSNLSGRVFEYLLDFEIIKKSAYSNDHFFFDPKFLNDYEEYRFENEDKLDVKKVQDLFHSTQVFKQITTKCKNTDCNRFLFHKVAETDLYLPRMNTDFVCTSCLEKVKNLFFIFKT